MVVNAHPVVFDEHDPRPMFDHLNRWAGGTLTGPAGWADTIEACGWWTDLSPRNQVLLASYRTAVGPAAGASAWARVPSTDPDRAPVPRAGEHGYVIRVPVTTTGTSPVSDRSRHGFTTAGSVDSMRWEPVFTAHQLVPAPHPSTLRAVMPPADLADGDGFADVVRRAVLRLDGRAPKTLTAPLRRLEVAAQHVAPAGTAVRLPAVLARQAAWVVAARVGHHDRAMPAFDPSILPARQRWELLVATRHTTGRLLTAMSHAVGVDLTASPLPKLDTTPDTEVRAGRRNLLSPAEYANLPAGVWTEVGPYRPDEWAARGIDADGRGAFYALTAGRYLAVYETADGARWRLEAVGARTRTGIAQEGHGGSFDLARRYALEHLRATQPGLITRVGPSNKLTVLSPSPVWMALAGANDDRTIARAFDPEVRAVVTPAAGGRWQAWLQNRDELTVIGRSRSKDGAVRLADTAAWNARVANAGGNLAALTTILTDAAGTPAWSREFAVTAIGDRLLPDERVRLGDPTITTRDLAALYGDVGLPANVIVTLLAHEPDHPAREIAAAALEHGADITATINTLHHTRTIAVVEAGGWLGASGAELRAAGATAAEILQTAPVEMLRELDPRPHTWAQAAGMLTTAGHPTPEAARLLIRMAPNPDTLAAGLAVLFDTYPDAVTVIGDRLDANELAALHHHYQPDQTPTTPDLHDPGVIDPGAAGGRGTRSDLATLIDELGPPAAATATGLRGLLDELDAPTPPATMVDLPSHHH